MTTADVSDCVVVLVTVASREEGERIAEALVSEQLAACVNLIGGCLSIYRWENQTHQDQEILLLIKTRRALFARVEARVRALHSYQTPEVIALPITAGSAAYMDWLRSVTTVEK